MSPVISIQTIAVPALICDWEPYLSVRYIDVTDSADFAELEGGFDTALIVNVLEHVPDEIAALKHLWDSPELVDAWDSYCRTLHWRHVGRGA